MLKEVYVTVKHLHGKAKYAKKNKKQIAEETAYSMGNH